MICFVIIGKGTERLYVAKSIMKQDQYKTVLQNHLIPELKDWFANGELFVSIQDGGPHHTAWSIETFFFLAAQAIPQAWTHSKMCRNW